MSDATPDPLVDPRGVRFAAALTTVVLALVLVTGSAGCWPPRSPCSRSARSPACASRPYSVAVPPARRAAARPAHRARGRRTGPLLPGRRPGLRRWSAPIGYATGVTALGIAATALALAAAFLNAAFGFCLGCEMYALIARLRTTDHHRELPHEPPGRPGHRRLGREEPRHRRDRLPRGRRGHHRLRRRPPSRRRQDRLDRPSCRTRCAATSSTSDQFEALLSAKGIGNDDTVVLYGGNNNWFAAYAYWQFKLYGHGDVKLLDGGRKKWELDGRTLTTDVADRPGDHVHRAGRPTCRSARSATRSSPRSAHKNLVDVRSPDEFSGKILAPAHLPQEQSQRPGHIPAAINIPWSKAANEDGTFKSDEELAKLYGDEGFDGSQGDHRLLPHRRALVAHVVRAARAARPRRRQELRRQLDRVRLAHRRADRAGRGRQGLMCGAPDQAVDAAAGHRPLQGDRAHRPGRRGRRAGGRRVRAAARRHRRVHRRGRGVGERRLPLLRRARHLDPARPVPRGNGEAQVTAEAPGLHDTVVTVG